MMIGVGKCVMDGLLPAIPEAWLASWLDLKPAWLILKPGWQKHWVVKAISCVRLGRGSYAVLIGFWCDLA